MSSQIACSHASIRSRHTLTLKIRMGGSEIMQVGGGRGVRVVLGKQCSEW